jgi:flagellar hook-associated protein 2
MPAIQFGGLSSGLDTTSIINALMTADQTGLTRLQTTHTSYDTQTTAYGKLGTALSDLLAKAKAFTVSAAGAGRSAVSSDTSAFSASATSGAAAGQYRITVDRLATATRATSTAAIGTAITDATATGMMSSLPLAGTVTAGQVGMVVDGTIVHATIGAPGSTSLADALGAIATAVQAQLQGSDPGATVTASIVNDKVQLAVSGGTGTHTVRFGSGADTSNALTIFGLAGTTAGAFASGTPITGSTALGVVRTTGTLNGAGLTSLTSTTAGKLTINGIDISYDTTTDSLNTVLSRINASNAGVTATIDRAGDNIVLTSKTAGAQVIEIADKAGTLGAALHLAPGTTNAQVIGTTAQVTVDGVVHTSDTNHITSAIPNVAFDLVSEGTGIKTLTVGVDRTGVASAIKSFVNSYNALADLLDTQTAQTPASSSGGTAGTSGPLAGEFGVTSLALSLRSTIMSVAGGFSGSIRSFTDLGVSTGAVGSAVGSTTRLSLDEDKLNKAIDTDPARVGELLGSVTGVMKPVVDQLTTLTKTNGLIDSRTKSLATQIRQITDQERQYQDRMSLKQAALEAKFANLESVLAQLQQTQSQLTAQSNARTTTG